MKTPTVEHPALLIIDMVKDNFDERKNLPITPLAQKIIAPINRLIHVFRENNWPIVFSTDAFTKQDFIFKGRMQPHPLSGTEGAEVIDALDRHEDDLWLSKPRFSAFFQTGLEGVLREKGVTLCAVAGISTNCCVLTSAFDALCHDFKAVLLDDCCAAVTVGIHDRRCRFADETRCIPCLESAAPISCWRSSRGHINSANRKPVDSTGAFG